MNKFISFEGVDGSGKTTLSKLTAERLGCKCLKSPPDILAKSRYILNGAGESVTVHYYLTGNCMVSYMAEEMLKVNSVVTDRYFTSTQAYHYGQITVLPPHIEPDLIVLVEAEWDTIESRLAQRQDRREHEKIPNLKRIMGLYERVLGGNEKVLRIDTTSETPNQCVNRILRGIKL
jgi:dTMP kinase